MEKGLGNPFVPYHRSGACGKLHQVPGDAAVFRVINDLCADEDDDRDVDHGPSDRNPAYRGFYDAYH